MSDLCYNDDMWDNRDSAKTWSVRKLDPLIVELIRVIAAESHVSAAEVITVAVAELEANLLARGKYPEGWRVPSSRRPSSNRGA